VYRFLLCLLFPLVFVCTEHTIVDTGSIDTLYVFSKDTVYNTVINRDTVYSIDTIINVDTVIISNNDTLFNYDTVIVAAETLYTFDSMYVTKTIVSKDTQYLSVDTLTLVNQKALSLSGLSGSVELSFLEEMNQLEVLIMNGVKSESFAPLAKLTNLKYLSLEKSAFNDISVLKHLSKLEYLNLDSCPVADTFDATLYPELRYLNISRAKFKTILPIVGLEKLETLLMDNMRNVKGVLKIIKLGKLNKLTLNGVGWNDDQKDIDLIIDSLPLLDSLTISAMDLATASISSMEKMRVFRIVNQCKKVTIVNMPLLNLIENRAADVESLMILNVPALNSITMDHDNCSISKVVVDSAPNLYSASLSIKICPSGVEWLSSFSVVSELSIGRFKGGSFYDIYPCDLSKFANLTRLELREGTYNILGMQGLSRVQYIDVSGSKITNWDVLDSCLDVGDTLYEQFYSHPINAKIPETVKNKMEANGVTVVQKMIN